MKQIAKGRIWLLGDNIDTDALAPTRYLHLPQEDYSLHCLEQDYPGFASGVREGDVIVAGEDFGKGSSREHASNAMRFLGIKAVIAKSIAPIMKRNLINLGIPLYEDPDLPDACSDGDSVLIEDNRLHNITKGWDSPLPPLQGFIMDIIEKGGLFPLLIEKGGISEMSRPFKDNDRMKEVEKVKIFPAKEKYVDTVVEMLNRGEVLLGPFDTTYGLFASIKRPEAIKRIYAMKKRGEDMPLTMIVPRSRFTDYAKIDDRTMALLENELDGPISIIFIKKKERVPDYVTSNLKTVSLADGENIFMKAVMERIEICGTSANIHGQPPPSTMQEALKQLGETVTIAVDGGPTHYGIGHTVLDMSTDPPKLLRSGPFETKKLNTLFPDLVSEKEKPIPDDLVRGQSVVDLSPSVEIKARKKR